MAISIERQKARCAFTALALGHAILLMPEKIDLPEGAVSKRKLAGICERVTRWHSAVCDEVGVKKLPPLNSQAVRKMMARFLGHYSRPEKDAAEREKRGAAMFWAALVFVWDCRISCPDAASSKAWRYLDLACEQLGRLWLLAQPEADVMGDKIYEELVW